MVFMYRVLEYWLLIVMYRALGHDCEYFGIMCCATSYK